MKLLERLIQHLLTIYYKRTGFLDMIFFIDDYLSEPGDTTYIEVKSSERSAKRGFSRDGVRVTRRTTIYQKDISRLVKSCQHKTNLKMIYDDGYPYYIETTIYIPVPNPDEDPFTQTSHNE